MVRTSASNRKGPEWAATAQGASTSNYRYGGARVVGNGIGFRMAAGVITAELALKVYVTEKVPASELTPSETAPTEIDGYPVDVEAVGDVVPQMYNRRFDRPVRCGVSIGHPRVTAGTLGCLVVLNNGRLCILSNNHVIANSNDARRGDAVIQPGTVDGGTSPSDRIGVLENFVPIRFPGPNQVDAAVAWTSFRFVDPRHVTYQLNPMPLRPRLGMTVAKNGRTTQSTIGTITELNVTISVGYSGGVATFTGQTGIRGVSGSVFSRGGDSGSLIVSAASRQPVALLFAGRRDNTLTFANPIQPVMSALGIRRFVHQR